MGAPLPMAEKLQAGAGLAHLASTMEVLKNYHFEAPLSSAMVVREPVGVVGMITPWNWPLNQITCKVAPALAAPTVKRVSQELGGKSPNVILEGADLNKAVAGGVMHMFNNSGQSCNAPSRMIVPLSKMKEVAAIAKGVAEKTKAGDPRAEGTTIGPVVSRIQWDKIQALIQKGIEEGATLVAGGPGLPEGVNKGFYVRPTIFADVTNDMTIAREEIFGPVLTILGAKDEEDAV